MARIPPPNPDHAGNSGSHPGGREPDSLLAAVSNEVNARVHVLPGDHLVVPLSNSESPAATAGTRFIESWKRAGIIVDTCVGHGNGGTPPTPPPA